MTDKRPPETPPETPAGPTRQPPPPRRPSETRRLVWKGARVFVTIGYRADHLTPCEIFYDSGYRSGSDMEVLVSDLCIVLSVMLQQDGMTADSLGKSMSTAFDIRTGAEQPGSILGLLLSELARPPAWLADLAKAPGDEDTGDEDTGQSAAGQGQEACP